MTSPLPPEHQRVDAHEVQGNLVGFNKDHMRLLFATFPSQVAGKAFLGGLSAGELANAADVLEINKVIKNIEKREREDSNSINSSGVNVALSFAGLSIVAPEDAPSFPEEFRAGMAARASILGDVDDSAPATWLPPFTDGGPVHAMVILAADVPADLDARTATILQIAQTAGVSLSQPQDGNARPTPQTGHEHFGFKDGISQPSIDGLTASSKGGSSIAAGEFLIGYPNQDGDISGDAQTIQPPTPSQPGYNPSNTSPVTIPALPTWAHNGSFVVYRRLRQNVQAFHDFTQAQASAANLTPEQLAAKLVGRWPSGAPLERVRGQSHEVDNSTSDPSLADESVLNDNKINNFGYQELDSDGHLTPRAAHIRKTYPRDETPPGHDEADRHRIIRRGLPYGEELAVGEAPYPGTGPVPNTQDRGLLFLCYQASLSRGFEFIQSQWANNNDFPVANDGSDPIISQDKASGSFTLPTGNIHLTLARWVTTTGGEYFFAPSISAIAHLAAPN